MTYPNEGRISEIAKLIKERDRAISMISSWQRKLDSVNATLAVMLGETATEAAPEPEPVPEPV